MSIQLTTVDHSQNHFSECFGISNERAKDIFAIVLESIRTSACKSEAFEKIVRTYADSEIECCMATMMYGALLHRLEQDGVVKYK